MSRIPRVFGAIALLVTCVSVVSAQQITGAITSPLSTPYWSHGSVPQTNAPFSPLANDVAIAYFDPTTPTHAWPLPANWGSLIMIAVTERISLASDNGFVDSVRIGFDLLQGDSVTVLLDPDSVLQTPVGIFHLDETVFNSVPSFAIATFRVPALQGPTRITVPFPHVAVPKNFHVVIIPYTPAGQQSAIAYVTGDSEAVRARTIENAHSTYIGSAGGQGASGVIDSNLTPAGDQGPLYSNLDITAYVEEGGAAAHQPTSAHPEITISPNPASATLRISKVEGPATIDLVDVLGRTVCSSRLSNNGSVNVAAVPSGRYTAFIHSQTGVQAHSVLIAR
jgi:hypothetical protein